jgi:hypothetical protein
MLQTTKLITQSKLNLDNSIFGFISLIELVMITLLFKCLKIQVCIVLL